MAFIQTEIRHVCIVDLRKMLLEALGKLNCLLFLFFVNLEPSRLELKRAAGQIPYKIP